MKGCHGSCRGGWVMKGVGWVMLDWGGLVHEGLGWVMKE